MCMAVGDHDPSHGAIRPVIERWDGASWSIETSAPGGGSLSAVACHAIDTCMAVGRGGGSAFAEAWDGIGWRATDARTRARLTGVACPSSSTCYGVGWYQYFARFPVIERWDGSHWSVMHVDWPINLFPMRLDGIECSSVDDCVAVGFGGRLFQNSLETLVMAWNGSDWSVPRTPSLPHASVSELMGVACHSTTACMAVGYGETKRHGRSFFKALGVRWDGARWSLTDPRNPRGAETAGLTAISCTSASFCMSLGTEWSFGLPGGQGANGSSTRGSNKNRNAEARMLFAEHWDGRRWSLESMAAAPRDWLPPIMYAVSCTSTSFCMAVGEGGGESSIAAVSQVWDGHAWSNVDTPDPRGQSELLGVSCVSPADCVAVGEAGSFFDSMFTVALHWDGRKWTEMQTPSPEVFSGLESVSCTQDGTCTAVGEDYPNLDAPQAPLAERWNGTKWSVQKTPNPGGGGGAILEGVSCPSANRCVAVGSSNPYSGRSNTLAELWNGRSWRITETPSGRDDALYAVDCRAATRCVAVGTRTNGTLAEIWSAGEWVVSSTPSPSQRAALPAVSCVDASTCDAAGLWFDGSFAHTLVMAYRAG